MMRSVLFLSVASFSLLLILYRNNRYFNLCVCMCVLLCSALPVYTRIDHVFIVVGGGVYIERIRLASESESHEARCQCQLSVDTGKNSRQDHSGTRVAHTVAFYLYKRVTFRAVTNHVYEH